MCSRFLGWYVFLGLVEQLPGMVLCVLEALKECTSLFAILDEKNDKTQSSLFPFCVFGHGRDTAKNNKMDLFY